MPRTWAKKAGRWWLIKVKFCPFCGVDALEEDKYWEEHNPYEFKMRGDMKDFTCRACGQIFRLSKSSRKIAADELFRLERKRAGGYGHPQKEEQEVARRLGGGMEVAAAAKPQPEAGRK